MSQKITSKNLSYSSDLPPFLRALHAQAGSSDEPSTTGQRRSTKKRSGSEEAEDAPLVVDEDGNVVDVEVDKEGVVKGGGDGDATVDDARGGGEDGGGKKEAAGSGKPAIGSRKRKVGRVIGEAAEEDSGKTSRGSIIGSGAKGGDVGTDGLKEKKTKKKTKKIKLSFDDEEG
ncbi:hypothetical protein ACRE_066710 [Hapsidospora chrysogenum ATCC 11550]|uniref:DUF4604 domain-containing protein n=1 Tax=Hapsidospora chrysogenum (strain ATCC 11550 / CBS 779.69 / DSM 880 / IAM 14645 / JCM 23072 / IMI 49137) TaxID=857340 RepID=A0A086SZS2_HAPC1|nr:hypothetical protein ACRE_066710 [Hapsidospora chrysogenum ATCC 11550]